MFRDNLWAQDGFVDDLENPENDRENHILAQMFGACIKFLKNYERNDQIKEMVDLNSINSKYLPFMTNCNISSSILTSLGVK